MLLQPLLGTLTMQSLTLPVFILCTKIDANAVHTMPFVLRVPEPLALENVSQMTSTVVAYDLRPHHAEARIWPLSHSARYGVPEGRPAASRVEFVVRFVERRVAGGAGVDAGGGVVLIVVA